MLAFANAYPLLTINSFGPHTSHPLSRSPQPIKSITTSMAAASPFDNREAKCERLLSRKPALAIASPGSALFFAGLMFFLFLASLPVQAATLTLTWSASSGPVAGYRVSYGSQSHNYQSTAPATPNLIGTTSYTTPDLPAGTYYFAVKAFDSAGNSSDYSNEVSKTITASVAAPTANFSANKTTGAAPLAINFTDSSTGTITSRSWDFGDGTTSTTQNPAKTYSSPGTYTVKLTVTGSGGSNTATKTNYVSVSVPSASTPPSTAAPVASFSASPTSATTATSINFTNTSTGNSTSWSWNFGDGTTSTAKNAIKTYTNPGTYTVKLIATGPGGSNTATKTNYISISAASPAASFSATPTSGPAPLSTTFKNTSTGTITSYSWNFGDGTTSTSANPTHTYSKTGTYTVSLTATGPAGSNSKTQTSYITVAGAGTKTGGLVAAYNFEEASGTTALDTSGQGNQGTISGSTRIAGKYGKALSFDGVDDLVTVNDSASLDLTTGMTLEAWVYPSTNEGWKPVIVKEIDSLYYLYASTAFGNAPAMGAKIGSYPLLYGDTALPGNGWTHLAATYDGTAERLYLNGTLVAQRSVSGTMEISANPLRIGGSSHWGEYFSGRIDDVRIYNRALTLSEIQTDMNTPVK
ncbi:MAG: PKD domain-containing protein [Candidatus Competibacter sp.]